LLVVIAVIGILIAVIGLVGVRVARGQKVQLTQTIMKNVKLATEQFADQNPLRSIYDRKENRGPDGVWNTADDIRPTFGPYPPYQLANPTQGVAWVLEPGNPFATLRNRLARDLGGQAGSPNPWVSDPFGGDNNDDIRALYTYLRLYARDMLAQVPASALKPLGAVGEYEYVNPAGTGTAPGTEGLTDVLGINDAWGVPLDYFLYVKLEYALTPSGTPDWRVTDRIPVLRSRGINREAYDTLKESGQLATRADDWIFSDPFPSPAAAGVNKSTGSITGSGAQASGWARAKAALDDYDYVP
jgi:type II secretory pathway pseudopilin PulG